MLIIAAARSNRSIGWWSRGRSNEEEKRTERAAAGRAGGGQHVSDLSGPLARWSPAAGPRGRAAVSAKHSGGRASEEPLGSAFVAAALGLSVSGEGAISG